MSRMDPELDVLVIAFSPHCDGDALAARTAALRPGVAYRRAGAEIPGQQPSRSAECGLERQRPMRSVE
jgi:hypothetical protein